MQLVSVACKNQYGNRADWLTEDFRSHEPTAFPQLNRHLSINYSCVTTQDRLKPRAHQHKEISSRLCYFVAFKQRFRALCVSNRCLWSVHEWDLLHATSKFDRELFPLYIFVNSPNTRCETMTAKTPPDFDVLRRIWKFWSSSRPQWQLQAKPQPTNQHPPNQPYEL